MISTEFDEVLNDIKMLKITLIRVIPKWDGQTIKEACKQRQIVTWWEWYNGMGKGVRLFNPEKRKMSSNIRNTWTLYNLISQYHPNKFNFESIRKRIIWKINYKKEDSVNSQRVVRLEAKGEKYQEDDVVSTQITLLYPRRMDFPERYWVLY